MLKKQVVKREIKERRVRARNPIVVKVREDKAVDKPEVLEQEITVNDKVDATIEKPKTEKRSKKTKIIDNNIINAE